MMNQDQFEFKIAVGPEKLDQLRQRIEKAVEEIEQKFGDVTDQERKKIGSLLAYAKTPVDDICYDHYKARVHRLMFPEHIEHPGIKGVIYRFYKRVVRRLLRQQLVFNQSVVGTLDDMHERLSRIEKKLGIVPESKDD